MKIMQHYVQHNMNIGIDIKYKVMKHILKKIWNNYCEAMYLAYYPYYQTKK